MLARGAIDFEMWVAIMYELRVDGRFRPGMPLLLDVREATGAPPPMEVPAVAELWGIFTPTNPCAILVKSSEAQQAAAGVGQLIPHLQVFLDEHAAGAWLRTAAP